MNTDRLPPSAPEEEQAILGCILLSPNETMAICMDHIQAGSEFFYDLRHQTIYEVLRDLYDSRSSMDMPSIIQALRDCSRLDEVGGRAYLDSLADHAGSAFNVAYHIGKVAEKAVLRKLIQTCAGAVGRVYEHEGNVTGLLDEVERDILSIRQEASSKTSKSMKELMRGAVTQIEDYHARQGRLMGLPTGLPDLDRILTGLKPGDMIVIAARPSIGKTSLGTQIAEHIAMVEKQPVGIFSLEMTQESLALRSLCAQARVNFRNIQDGFLADRDFPRLTVASGRLSQAPIHIDDRGGISIMQLRARARRMVQQFGVKLFVIDYLQLLHADTSRGRRIEHRQQEITEISGGIKALAKELGIPVIVLSQLNRDMEKNKGRKPVLADLRESGSIEQDADVVILLYKPDAEDENANADNVATNAIVAKQRNGPTGEVKMTFFKPYTRFECVAKIDNRDVPQPKGQHKND